MEKPMYDAFVKSERKNRSFLMKLYEKGKLGSFPVAENRLRAGMLFANDFKNSVFSQRTTTNYDKLFVTDRGAKNGADDFRCDAADRYLRALKSIYPFGVYALHFLRDELNVADFIVKYPVLNHGSKRTYRMVYKAINIMLDKLAVFYDRERAKR